MDPDFFLKWFPVLVRYGGLLGVGYILFFEGASRPGLLTLLGLMMGVSEISTIVRKKKNGNGNNAPKT
jgi:hypothetical protein